MQSWIFRFVSILGNRYSHGHIFDFVKQLQKHPEYLNVLGDGTQKKSYLNVKDCVDAMLIAVNRYYNNTINIFNLGTDEYIELCDSIQILYDYFTITPETKYSGGNHGWVGDNPLILLDCSKIKNIGWKSKYTIKESIIETIKYLEQNEWLLEAK